MSHIAVKNPKPFDLCYFSAFFLFDIWEYTCSGSTEFFPHRFYARDATAAKLAVCPLPQPRRARRAGNRRRDGHRRSHRPPLRPTGFPRRFPRYPGRTRPQTCRSAHRRGLPSASLLPLRPHRCSGLAIRRSEDHCRLWDCRRPGEQCRQRPAPRHRRSDAGILGPINRRQPAPPVLCDSGCAARHARRRSRLHH